MKTLLAALIGFRIPAWVTAVSVITLGAALFITRGTLEDTKQALAVATAQRDVFELTNKSFADIAQRQNDAVTALVAQRKEDVARYEVALTVARRTAAKADARADQIEALPKPDVVTVDELNRLLNEALKEVQK